MEKNHFIGGDNKEYGPYSLKTMRTYRSQNRMNKKSMVKKDGGKFQPAANFEELALAKKKKAAKKKPPSTNYNLKDYSSFVDPLSVRKLAVKIVTSIDKKYSQPWHQAAAIFDYVKKINETASIHLCWLHGRHFQSDDGQDNWIKFGCLIEVFTRNSTNDFRQKGWRRIGRLGAAKTVTH